MAISTQHISLNAKCPFLEVTKGAYTGIFTPPYHNLKQDLLATWAIWKVWWTYKHSTFNIILNKL
jgi:hypothetical protein